MKNKETKLRVFDFDIRLLALIAWSGLKTETLLLRMSPREFAVYNEREAEMSWTFSEL